MRQKGEKKTASIKQRKTCQCTLYEKHNNTKAATRNVGSKNQDVARRKAEKHKRHETTKINTVQKEHEVGAEENPIITGARTKHHNSQLADVFHHFIKLRERNIYPFDSDFAN